MGRERCALVIRPDSELGRIARSDIPIQLIGEPGVGKTYLARLIHDASGRSGDFVHVNAAELVGDIAGARLVGHRKGAFTGAVRDQVGLFVAADGGTLFIDEVADLPAATQAMLLTMVERGEVLPVGATRMTSADVRIITATNKDLEAEIAAGRFRRDLQDRLAVWAEHVKPLRERPAEIVPIARAIAAALDPPREIDHVAASALENHDWPRNVRELEQRIRVAAALDPSGPISGPIRAKYLKLRPPIIGPHALLARLATHLSAHGAVAMREFAELAGLPERTAKRHLARWAAEGRLIREGRGRSTVYRLP